MGLWSRILGEREQPGAADRTEPRFNVAFQEPVWHELGLGRKSIAGESVNWQTALRCRPGCGAVS